MEQFLQVGVISSTHGLRGEVKVFPTTDDAARFQTLKNVVLDTGREKLDLEIQSVRFFKQSTFSNCFINSIRKCCMTGFIQMFPVNFTWKSNF